MGSGGLAFSGGRPNFSDMNDQIVAVIDGRPVIRRGDLYICEGRAFASLAQAEAWARSLGHYWDDNRQVGAFRASNRNHSCSSYHDGF